MNFNPQMPPFYKHTCFHTNNAKKTTPKPTQTANMSKLTRVQHHKTKKTKFVKVDASTDKSETRNEVNTQSSQIPPTQTTTFVCLICAETRHCNTVFENCAHNDICFMCTLSLRRLMKDNQCCICKVESSKAILTTSLPKRFSEYNLDQLISMQNDGFSGIYVDHPTIQTELEQLVKLQCNICPPSETSIFKNMSELKEHTSKEHNLHYCKLCLDNRKVFLRDQKLYSFKELQLHVKFGETDSTHGRVNGHPLCKFCNRRFYEDGELFKHMYQNHETCFLCEKNGIQFEFYRDYPALDRHFNKCHFPCEDPVCQQKRFVVFNSDIELKTHALKEHTKDKNKKKKMTLDFFAGPSSSGQSLQSQSQQESRRNLRVGNVDSSVIRFADVGGTGGYFNDGVNSGGSKVKEVKRSKHEEKKPATKSESVTPESFMSAFTPQSRVANEKAPIARSENLEYANLSLKEKTSLLVKKMKELLPQDEFNQFRQVSNRFQNNEMFATEYYAKFIETLGEESTKTLFPLLIETLPESQAQKADALILARNVYQSGEFKKTTKPKQKAEPKKQQNNANNTKKKPASEPPPNWGPVTPDVPPQKKTKPKMDDFPTLQGTSSVQKSAQAPNQSSPWFSTQKSQVFSIQEPEKLDLKSSKPQTVNGIVIVKKKKKK